VETTEGADDEVDGGDGTKRFVDALIHISVDAAGAFRTNDWATEAGSASEFSKR
jgi:hypothetical protein